MLQGMQAKRCDGRGIRMAENAENTTFIVDIVGLFIVVRPDIMVSLVMADLKCCVRRIIH